MIFSLFKILKPKYSFPPSTSIKSQFAKSCNSCLTNSCFISLPTSSTPAHYCYLGGGVIKPSCHLLYQIKYGSLLSEWKCQIHVLVCNTKLFSTSHFSLAFFPLATSIQATCDYLLFLKIVIPFLPRKCYMLASSQWNEGLGKHLNNSGLCIQYFYKKQAFKTLIESIGFDGFNCLIYIFSLISSYPWWYLILPWYFKINVLWHVCQENNVGSVKIITGWWYL